MIRNNEYLVCSECGQRFSAEDPLPEHSGCGCRLFMIEFEVVYEEEK